MYMYITAIIIIYIERTMCFNLQTILWLFFVKGIKLGSCLALV